MYDALAQLIKGIGTLISVNILDREQYGWQFAEKSELVKRMAWLRTVCKASPEPSSENGEKGAELNNEWYKK